MNPEPEAVFDPNLRKPVVEKPASVDPVDPAGHSETVQGKVHVQRRPGPGLEDRIEGTEESLHVSPFPVVGTFSRGSMGELSPGPEDGKGGGEIPFPKPPLHQLLLQLVAV